MKATFNFLFASLAIAAMGLAGCSTTTSSDIYTAEDFGVQKVTLRGKVVSARIVEIQREGGLGTVVGAAAGGVAGSEIGGGTTENILGAIGGAVVGGIIGHGIDRAASRTTGVEYVIEVEDGSLLTIVQGVSPHINEGEAVFVQLYSGDRSRVIPVHGSPEPAR